LIGKPHLERDGWRTDLLREIHGVGAGPDDWPLAREVSTFDYFETWRVLEDIYQQRFLKDRFTLSPMGSKLQALGCSLFCESRKDVRVVFATPGEYRAAGYTTGVRNVWHLDFGSTVSLRRTVEQVGELLIERSDGALVLSGTKRVAW
jgi:hypothetical protein